MQQEPDIVTSHKMANFVLVSMGKV